MGLPLFITPVEPDVVAKSAEKTAAVPRSSIRRHRMRAGSRVGDSLGRISPEERRRRMLEAMGNIEGDRNIAETQQGNPPDQNGLSSSLSRSRTVRRMFEFERMRLRDSLSFERQHGPEAEIDGPLMPPVPESRDYSRIEEGQREEIRRLDRISQDLRRMARRRPAPTPPYQDADYAYLSRSGIGSDSPQPNALTPALSPSHSTGDNYFLPRRDSEDSNTSYTTQRLSSTANPNVSSNERLRLDASDRVGSALSQRIRALNRASNNLERSRRLIRQARMDGLGDRDRSLSPEGSAAWDTLLTSITPDPQPPSAGSSFASASAAAAASSSGSGPASASTSMTSPGRTDESQMVDLVHTEREHPYVIDCVSDSGSNTEDEEEDVYELRGLHGTRETYWRSYADIATPRDEPHDSTRNSSMTDAEGLGGWHRIISRLTERDDIPDAWWASAGLMRTLRREPTS